MMNGMRNGEKWVGCLDWKDNIYRGESKTYTFVKESLLECVTHSRKYGELIYFNPEKYSSHEGFDGSCWDVLKMELRKSAMRGGFGIFSN